MTRFVFILLGIVDLLLLSNCTCSKEKASYYTTQKVKRSIVGITGKDSSQPYIEFYYTKDSNGQNVTVHEWVKPPYLFGDIDVNLKIQVRFPIQNHNQEVKDYVLDYQEKGESYLQIINHSNQPIEMFVATNTETGISTWGGQFKNVIGTHPRPMYQYAPIYYLLFPTQTPNLTGMEIVWNNGSNRVKNDLSFTPTTIGNIAI